MSDEPQFLELDQVLRLQLRSLAEHGGTAGVRDPGLVESAIASARNTFVYGGGDLFEVAAAYAFHLAEAQAFLDGNKRAGTAAALVFLEMNGIELPASADLELYRALIDIAEKRLTKTGLAGVLRLWSASV